MIRIYTKKKDLPGNFHRACRIYTQEKTVTYDHAFSSAGSGMVIPHGVYDGGRNQGFLHLSTSHDTSELACDSIATWWKTSGRKRYSAAKKLLVLCDGGGSNGATRYVFKEALQKLADRLGIEIQVAHYPPYCSKYNPIEHRLFCHVTRACRGVIFRGPEVVRHYMAKTETSRGLNVKVSVIEKVYEGVRRCDAGFKESMKIVFDKVLPKWNYRAIPQTRRPGKLFPAYSLTRILHAGCNKEASGSV
ncbi:ISAzo13 family transposase, partial [bacterium]|nr:ISAzo13 family transposase [bacterium]